MVELLGDDLESAKPRATLYDLHGTERDALALKMNVCLRKRKSARRGRVPKSATSLVSYGQFSSVAAYAHARLLTTNCTFGERH